MDWTASAVLDWSLQVSWAGGADRARGDRGVSGITILHAGDRVPGEVLARLAPAWCVIEDRPGWGGRRFERLAAEALAAVPGIRFVPVPRSVWCDRARAANVRTREALVELLVALSYPVSIADLRLAARA